MRVIDGYYDDASAAAHERAAETGACWMHPFDQPEVVAGQGTIGIELSEQAPDADTVLVAVGGGGLIAGIAAWYAGDVRVVGVEPVSSRCLDAALEAGEPVDVPVGGIAADSLGTRRAGDIAFAVARGPRRSRACSSTTTRSVTRNARSGGTSGCSPSPVGRPRWPRCGPVRTCPSPASGSSCWCAGRTPTPRRSPAEPCRPASIER